MLRCRHPLLCSCCGQCLLPLQLQLVLCPCPGIGLLKPVTCWFAFGSLLGLLRLLLLWPMRHMHPAGHMCWAVLGGLAGAPCRSKVVLCSACACLGACSTGVWYKRHHGQCWAETTYLADALLAQDNIISGSTCRPCVSKYNSKLAHAHTLHVTQVLPRFNTGPVQGSESQDRNLLVCTWWCWHFTPVPSPLPFAQSQ